MQSNHQARLIRVKMSTTTLEPSVVMAVILQWFFSWVHIQQKYTHGNAHSSAPQNSPMLETTQMSINSRTDK